VIGVRSFGSDATLVVRHVAAAVRGLQSQGVAACLKHFPGHGATTADSHQEVPTLDRTLDELNAVELPPFASGIAAGARAVMTGHLMVPVLDAVNLATVSPAINTALLRERLGFAGTIVTDALEMRALADTLGMPGGFVAALVAGADAVETGAQDYPHIAADIADAVERAVDDGTLPLERLNDAAARTSALASPATHAKLSAPQYVDASRRADNLGCGGCIEVIGELPQLVRPLVVEARPPDGMASGALPWSFADALRERVPEVADVQVYGSETTVESVPGRTLVAVVRDPLRHPWQAALVERADVVVDVGWPADLATRAPVVRTRGVAPGLLAAAADALANA
ncbi:MAG TPA: glycoside hydrolase family 3 N-terminal domain-containing protein, partial [Jatrophihabitantaceae bacterium]|nr:glycoside hydrolase family 3 N-terminal domain-containing protein [Jatrophihabitantaceae bacterium]